MGYYRESLVNVLWDAFFKIQILILLRYHKNIVAKEMAFISYQ